MSLSLRAVKEIWGKDTYCFIKPSDVLRVFKSIALRVSTTTTEEPYGNQIVFWVADGEAFLNYFEQNPACIAEAVWWIVSNNPCMDPDSLTSLFENLRRLAPAWRKSLDEDGSLRIYIDAY